MSQSAPLEELEASGTPAAALAAEPAAVSVAGATHVRYAIVWVTTLTALIMYLDRACLSEIAKYDAFTTDLALSPEANGWILGAFFFAYALAQVPAGALSDRFGARSMMAFYVTLWSVFTALGGLTQGFVGLMVTRIGCGLAQAGAFPTSGGLLSRWIPFRSRGMASAIVALGGRAGHAMAPYSTQKCIALLGGWRAALGFYGLIGVGIAAWFWHTFREKPEEHPRTNEQECELIRSSLPNQTAAQKDRRIPMRAILASGSMWCMSLTQFFTNIGWAFLITWMPTYFVKVQHLEMSDAARMSTLSLFGGMIGLVLGGWITDQATRWLGLRWGRSAPVALSRFVAMAAYVGCLKFDSPAAVAFCFAIIGMATDLGIAGTWAFYQDVGGRHVGAALGWGNMFGNLGAALVAVVLPLVVDMKATTADWDAAFILCGAGFLISGVAALGVNATIPLVQEPPAAERAEG